MSHPHQDTTHWFDSQGGLLARVRSMRSVLNSDEIATHLVEEGAATAEQVWLCIKACEVLDGKEKK